MLTTSHAAAEVALPQLAEQFTQWRQSRRTPRGPRIPEALWTEAVRLAQVLSRAPVAKALGLKPQALNRRCAAVEEPSPAAPAAPRFVEVATPWRTPTTEVEIQRPDGTRLRITYSETAPALAALVQAFLESR